MVADFGFQGFPASTPGIDRMTHYRTVLETAPPEFSTVWISDHLQFGPKPTIEGWTLLTFLAGAFPRFRYGHLVLSQSYRNPALLAKMAAALQELTGGRFILGLGAGWHEEEYRAYGYEYPSGSVRVAQLAEAIEVIRAVWTQSPATYHGTYYHIDDLICEPKPDPPIPIMIGTEGPKALAVTARLADMWNWDGPWEAVYRKPFETLRSHCESIGRPFEEIGLTAGIEVSLPADLATFGSTYLHPFYGDKIVFHPFGPTPADVIREVERLVDVGVSHFQISFDEMHTYRRFIDEVLPIVRLERHPQALV